MIQKLIELVNFNLSKAKHFVFSVFFSLSEIFSLRCCLAFCLIFPNIQPSVAYTLRSEIFAGRNFRGIYFHDLLSRSNLIRDLIRKKKFREIKKYLIFYIKPCYFQRICTKSRCESRPSSFLRLPSRKFLVAKISDHKV